MGWGKGLCSGRPLRQPFCGASGRTACMLLFALHMVEQAELERILTGHELACGLDEGGRAHTR